MAKGNFGLSMKEIVLQKQDKTGSPFSQEDIDRWNEYKDNQLIRCKTYGVQKPRSYQQLKLFWACCRKVADNTKDQHWNHPDKVAFQVKIKLQFVDMTKTIVDANGNVHLWYRSISYAELPHMMACNFFDRAFPIMAKKIGITTDELLKNANK